jgi:flavodoxin
MKNALIVYWSKTGNTEKVANAIKQGLEEVNIQVTMKRPEAAENEDYFNYDLVCIGCPSYHWHTPEPIARFLKKNFEIHKESGKIKLGAPQIDGKKAIVFVTYSGPHTGIDEATPVGKDIGQYFEHIGIHVVAEWYVLSEFHGAKEPNRAGRLGDLRGKPDAEQLALIKEKAANIIPRLP